MVFVLVVVIVVGGCGVGGDGRCGVLKCILIFNFHGLRCNHKAKIYRISKIKYIM